MFSSAAYLYREARSSQPTSKYEFEIAKLFNSFSLQQNLEFEALTTKKSLFA